MDDLRARPMTADDAPAVQRLLVALEAADRTEEHYSVEDVLEDESLFGQVSFHGFTFSEGGQDAPPLVLVDMEPGTYTIVCFVDVPEGIPHVMRGMILEFEVTAP